MLISVLSKYSQPRTFNDGTDVESSTFQPKGKVSAREIAKWQRQLDKTIEQTIEDGNERKGGSAE